MQPLSNPRHELFAQKLAEGLGITEAYISAGYSDSPAGASRLLKKVKFRVDEIKAQATRIAVDKLAITEERILREYARIGFADIRDAVDWSGTLVTEEDNPDGGDVLVIKNIHSSHVRLRNASDLSDDAAAAIAEVSQTPTGGLRVKMHAKQPALDAMADHLGIRRPTRIEHTGRDGGPIETKDVSARDVIESRIAGIATRGEAEGDTRKPH